MFLPFQFHKACCKHDKVQDYCFKIKKSMFYEDKIHGAFHIKVIKLLQSLYCS